MAKNWSNLCNFYSKVICLNFCLNNIFLLLFVESEYVMFCNNIVKISEKNEQVNLLKA